jgi:predicted nucleic acid-binding protein
VIYLLDTNVISELVKSAPDAKVVAWVNRQSQLDIALSALTLGEIEKGIGTLAAGARRTSLEAWARTEIPRQFHGRLLPVDADVAIAWGAITAADQRAGRASSVIDTLLVATAHVHGLTLVTRNVADCAGRGVPVYDPWTGTLQPERSDALPDGVRAARRRG